MIFFNLEDSVRYIVYTPSRSHLKFDNLSMMKKNGSETKKFKLRGKHILWLSFQVHDCFRKQHLRSFMLPGKKVRPKK